jgi:hypothetical protein
VSSATTDATLQQAQAVDALLDSSASGRHLVGPVVIALADCNSSIAPTAAVSSLQQAVSNRTGLLQQLGQLQVDALPDGASLRSLLQAAWNHSLQADQHYLNWAQSIANGSACNTQNSEKLAGDAASVSATQAKASFVSAWNASVAGPQNLTPRQESNL